MFDWCKDPAKVCLFWGLVLVLLVVVLLKLYGMIGSKNNTVEKQSNREFKQKTPYSGGATQRFAQENETPYLRNCIDYVYEMKANADQILMDAVDEGAVKSGEVSSSDIIDSARADSAALASTNVNSSTAEFAGNEFLTASVESVSHNGVGRKSINQTERFRNNGCPRGQVKVGTKCFDSPLGSREQLAGARQAPVHWFIGDNITQMKNEVSGQSPDLDTNRWTMQVQNQVSDLRSDTVDQYLKEDILFRRTLANM